MKSITNEETDIQTVETDSRPIPDQEKGPGSDIGDRIQTVRGNVHRSVVAEALGISLQTLRRYETGERQPDADFIRAFCDHYSINPSWLLRGQGPMLLDAAVPYTVLVWSGPFYLRLQEALTGRDMQRIDRLAHCEGQLPAFLKGEATPRLDQVVAIAKATGINLGWLITGEEPKALKQKEIAPPPPPLHEEELKLAVETIEEALERTGRAMKPEAKAEMVTAVYQLFVEGEGKVSKATALRLVTKSAA